MTYRQQRRLGRVQWAKLDGRVDVEHALLAARRPDGALHAEDVRLEVVGVCGAPEAFVARDLRN